MLRFSQVVQVVYEVNVKGVDERRLVGVQLQKLAEGEAGADSLWHTVLLCIFFSTFSYKS